MPRTLGVEEEFNLVDLKTRRLTARAPELLAQLSDTYVAELQRCVVEMNSRVVELSSERRQLWCAIGDTERMNRAVGLGPLFKDAKRSDQD